MNFSVAYGGGMRAGNQTAVDSSVAETVVLLNERGEPIGEESKWAVHHESTPLHLAFSLYLRDPAGRVLMTRRALSKLTWPGVWTNTCCGHPRLGESFPDAIARRLDFELGMTVRDLEPTLPDFRYRARDASGVWENEICPVYVGRTGTDAPTVRANPAEVVEWAWVDWDDLVAAARATPFAFSPWAVSQLGLLTLK